MKPEGGITCGDPVGGWAIISDLNGELIAWVVVCFCVGASFMDLSVL